MILPYGHERSVRSLPWATASIFALCVVTFFVTAGPMERSDQEAWRLFSEIRERYRENPYLDLDPATQDRLLRSFSIDDNQREVFLETLREQATERSRRTGTDEQEELDELVASYWRAYRASVAYRFGVVPDRLSGVSLVTHQFLHAGWLHLVGNLLFLYLAAPLVEERWGPALFAVFYLLAGVVAALFWAARYPDLEVPLVGASGAIAGVMGAFLICFGASKIKFFYWFGIVWGRFEAPAWLMLPLWLATEVLSGRATDVASQGHGGGGVAHWAHVWGFIFGAAFAAIVTRLGVGCSQPAAGDADLARRIDDAMLAGRAGRVEAGLAELRAAAAANPDDDRAPNALWQLALQTGRAAEAAPVMLGLVRRAARLGDDEAVVERWRLLMAGAPRTGVDPVLAMRVAEVARRRHDDAMVAEVLERVEIDEADAVPASVLERLGHLAAECGDRAAKSPLVAAALADERLPGELRRALAAVVAPAKGRAQAAPKPADRPSGPATPAVELRPAERLRVADAVPKALDDSALTVFLERGRGRVPLASVRAVAVAAIHEGDRRPYLVVDLLLDSPFDGASELRVVRLSSFAFDPRRLVGGDTAMAAFRRLLEAVLDRSSAVPLPDEASVRNPGSRSFPSIESYQHEVLGVMG